MVEQFDNNFKEKVAEWRGKVYQALVDIDKSHQRFEQNFRDLSKRIEKNFRELDNKTDCNKDEVKEIINEKIDILATNWSTDRIKLQKHFDNDVIKIKTKVNNLYIKVVALGATAGTIVAVILKFILDKV